jgi:hypothetical protein
MLRNNQQLDLMDSRHQVEVRNKRDLQELQQNDQQFQFDMEQKRLDNEHKRQMERNRLESNYCDK